MKITVAQGSGFCFGVRRAYDILEGVLAKKNKDDKVFTLGSFVHNPIITEQFEKRGVCITDETQLDALAAQASPSSRVTVLFRTHGVSRELRRKAALLHENNPNFNTVDCTCPCVLNIHRIVEKEQDSPDDSVLLILGDKDHPEVRAIRSYFDGECVIFKDLEELKKADIPDKKIVFVQQTTQLLTECKLCKNFLSNHFTNLNICATICKVTEERQKETAMLASRSDVMLVLGGRNSSNTNKLYKIAKEILPETYFVENVSELPLDCIGPETNLGITAGASTPDSLIEEAIRIMENIEEKDFATLLKESENKNIRTGDKVCGTVVSVDDREIKVDLGSNYTGVIVATEATDDNTVKLAEQFHIGDEIVAIVTKTNDELGIANLSKRQADMRANAGKLTEAFESGEIVEGKVVGAVKGGVIVSAFSTRIFVPASYTGIPKDGDLGEIVGTVQQMKIVELPAAKGRRAVASITAVRKEQRAAELQEFWASMEVGKVFEGVVKSMTDYGVFVNLGPVDGMVHRTELSWVRFKTPADIVSIGDTLKVYVKDFDPETKRISLGAKTEENNPWYSFVEKYQVGDTVSVKVVSLKTYGAFAEIIPGVDGLIHISQIADRKLGNPAEMLHVGDVVDVKITDVDTENRKISLSIRELLEPAVEDEAVSDSDVAVETENTDAE